MGVDAESGLVYTVLGTSGIVNDVAQASALLHGNETDASADAGYQGVDRRSADGHARWHVAMRPGRRKTLDLIRPLAKMIDQVEENEASIRAKAEYPFRAIKR